MSDTIRQLVEENIKRSTGRFIGNIHAKEIANYRFDNYDIFIVKVPKEKKKVDGKEVEVDGELKLGELTVHDDDMIMFNDGFLQIGNMNIVGKRPIIHTYEWNDADIGDERVIKLSEFQSLICWLQNEYNRTIPLDIIDK